MIKITAYTDGSAITTGERLGGIGAYIKYNNKEYFISKGYKNTTISRMEQLAILAAIKKVPVDIESQLTIYSDSQFICKSFNEGWLENWQLDNFVGRKNADIWRDMVNEIYNKRRLMKFEIIHTRGHLKDLNNPIVYGNAIADLLANYRIHKTYFDDSI
jgi:ribonuclease HI